MVWRSLSLMVLAGAFALGCAGGDAVSPVSVARIDVPKPTPNFGGIVVGGQVTLRAVAYDLQDRVVPTPRVTWRSSDGAVASVDGSGVVTGRAPGGVTITAQAPGGDVWGSLTFSVTASSAR